MDISNRPEAYMNPRVASYNGISAYANNSRSKEGDMNTRRPESLVRQRSFRQDINEGDSPSHCNNESTNKPGDKKSDEPKELKPSNFVFFASNSTLHGMNHIFTEGKFTVRRAMWAVAFFSSLSLFLYQAYDRYSYYRGHPHVTKLDEEEAQIMNFPAITICNMNSFRLSKVTTDDYYFIGESLLGLFDTDYSLRDGGFRDNRTWPFVKSRIDPILRQRNDYKPKSPNFNMFEFYNRTGHDVWGIVKSCKYRGVACNNLSLWQPVYTRYGKCYTFNAGILSDPLTTLKGGVDNGLEILLDTQQNEYMPVWAETDEISVEAGFKIQIHTQGEPPFIHELGFGISPGFQTLVATQEQRITFLPEPWGKCESGTDKWKYSLYSNYSISACRITCETKFVYKNCKCRMIHMPGNTTFCSPEQYKRCADKALDYLVMKDDKECVCDTPCEVTRYNLEMSALQLPSAQASSFLAYKYGVTEDYVKANFAKLNVFFEALNYETIEQKVAYEIPGLFGDIGGQMGLFIGASILTILELFDYVYEVMKEKTWGKKLRKVKTTEPASQTLIDGKEHQNIEDTASTYVGGATNYTPNSYQNGRPDHQPSHQGMEYPTSSHGRRGDDYRSLPPPPPQYWGNSLTPHREDPESRAETNGRTSLDALKRKLKSGGKETSMSYNDLYRMPEKWNSAAGGEYGQSSFTTLRYPTAASTDGYPGNAHPNMGYATAPRGVGSIFSPNSEMSQQQLPSMLGSPSRNNSEYRDYASTLETDIH